MTARVRVRDRIQSRDGVNGSAHSGFWDKVKSRLPVGESRWVEPARVKPRDKVSVRSGQV